MKYRKYYSAIFCLLEAASTWLKNVRRHGTFITNIFSWKTALAFPQFIGFIGLSLTCSSWILLISSCSYCQVNSLQSNIGNCKQSQHREHYSLWFAESKWNESNKRETSTVKETIKAGVLQVCSWNVFPVKTEAHIHHGQLLEMVLILFWFALLSFVWVVVCFLVLPSFVLRFVVLFLCLFEFFCCCWCFVLLRICFVLFCFNYPEHTSYRLAMHRSHFFFRQSKNSLVI